MARSRTGTENLREFALPGSSLPGAARIVPPIHATESKMIHFTGSFAPVASLALRFYREHSGAEPVRDWLRALPADERREIGADLRTVQIGWPIGMPVVAHVERGLWEVRTRLPQRIARVLFTLEGGEMILLHGFIKKDRKAPRPDLDLARQRLKNLRSAR